MSCQTPVMVPSKAKDAKQGQWIPVPCGKCLGCLQDRRNAWIYRLESEMRSSKHAYFVTLTYEDAFLPLNVGDVYSLDNLCTYTEYLKFKNFRSFVTSLNPKDLQNYFKRVRKSLPSDCKIKYFACGEYGDGTRPHYHFCLYSNYDNPVILESAININWSLGFVTIEPLFPARVAYVTKYILKDNPENRIYDNQCPPFQRASRGLGVEGFLKDEKILANLGNDTFTGYPLSNGARIPLPRYFRKNFYAHETFTSDRIQEQEYQRTKKERLRFQNFAISYRLEHYNPSIEEIHRAYLRYNDFEESARVHKLLQRRKKDF